MIVLFFSVLTVVCFVCNVNWTCFDKLIVKPPSFLCIFLSLMFPYCSAAPPIHRYKDRKSELWPSGFFYLKLQMLYHSLILFLTAQNPRWAECPGQLCIFQRDENWESPPTPTPISHEKACGMKGGFCSSWTVFALWTGEGLGPCSMFVHSRPLASWLATLIHRCLWPVSALIGIWAREIVKKFHWGDLSKMLPTLLKTQTSPEDAPRPCLPFLLPSASPTNSPRSH